MNEGDECMLHLHDGTSVAGVMRERIAETHVVIAPWGGSPARLVPLVDVARVASVAAMTARERFIIAAEQHQCGGGLP